jgi:hypothetical protein
MIIFESFLTNFKASVILEAAGAEVEIGLKPNHQNQVLLVQIPETLYSK